MHISRTSENPAFLATWVSSFSRNGFPISSPGGPLCAREHGKQCITDTATFIKSSDAVEQRRRFYRTAYKRPFVKPGLLIGRKVQF